MLCHILTIPYLEHSSISKFCLKSYRPRSSPEVEVKQPYTENHPPTYPLTHVTDVPLSWSVHSGGWEEPDIQTGMLGNDKCQKFNYFSSSAQLITKLIF